MRFWDPDAVGKVAFGPVAGQGIPAVRLFSCFVLETEKKLAGTRKILA